MTDPAIKICQASAVSHAALHQGMMAGFSDYLVPMRLSAADFDFTMTQRGLQGDSSYVALAEGKVVAIWLVAQEGPAAYLIASGTGPAHRGQGLAWRLAEESFAALRAAGAETFQTEVIEGNSAAERLYERMGLVERRMLDCYDLNSVEAPAASDPGIGPVEWFEIAAEAAALRDWAPSWQNADHALSRVPEALHGIAHRDDQGLAGYAVLFRPNGTLAQIAVRHDRRGAGLGRALLGRMRAFDPEAGLRLLNADGGDEGFARFVARAGGKPLLRQRELFMKL